MLAVTPALDSVFMIMASGFCELLCVPLFWKAANSCCNAWVVASADVLVEPELELALVLVLELLSESDDAAWP